MSPARLTATAVDRSMKLIRLPVDLVIGRLPGADSGPGAAARESPSIASTPPRAACWPSCTTTC